MKEKKDTRVYFNPFKEWFENFIWDPNRDPMANEIQTFYTNWIDRNWKMTENISVIDRAWAAYFAGIIISGQAENFNYEMSHCYTEAKIHDRTNVFFEFTTFNNGFKKMKNIKSFYTLKEFLQAIFMPGYAEPFSYFKLQRRYKLNRRNKI